MTTTAKLRQTLANSNTIEVDNEYGQALIRGEATRRNYKTTQH